MLCDTGPLVAVIDGDDEHHQASVEALAALPPRPLKTTWACVTESMYLLYRAAGHAGQAKLWDLLERQVLEIIAADLKTLARLRQLMAKYRDAPMDFADASLVVAAEQLNERELFTFDEHFRTYLIHDRHPFEVIP
jgi:predicted nucleic acid-binding protein